MASLAGIVISFVVLGFVFQSIQRLLPAIRGKPIRRKGFSVHCHLLDVHAAGVAKGLTRVGTLSGVAAIALMMAAYIFRSSPCTPSCCSFGSGINAAQLFSCELCVRAYIRSE